MAKTILVSSRGVKNIGLGDFDRWLEQMWNEQMSGDTATSELYRRVPWLFRATGLRAFGLAGLPFSIYQGETEIAVSDDWDNRPDSLAWFDDPEVTFWLTEAARTLTGAAYFGRLRNRLAKATGGLSELRYYAPGTVEPVIDKVQGLVGFERKLDGVTMPLSVEEVLYFWHPDPFTEIGEPSAWPALAACNAAGVLLNVDEFAKAFFQRGAIKATVLTIEGQAAQRDKDELKEWWERAFSGIKNAFNTRVVNAAVKPVVIGEGIKELENNDLDATQRSAIAAALDIPETILFSGSASGIGGGGVSEADDLRFAEQFLKPASKWHARAWNKQVFGPLGLRLVFNLESLKVYQEDETARSTSLSTILDAVNKAKTKEQLECAMTMLGYDVSDEDLVKLFVEPQAPPPQLAPFAGQNAPPDQTPPQDTGNAPDNAPANVDEPAKAIERGQFKRWAEKRIKQGKPLDGFTFEHLTESEQQALKAEALPLDTASPFADYP